MRATALPILVCLSAGAAAAAGCRSATQIEVQVTTDLPCGRANGGASLTSGSLVEIEGAPPTTTSRTCTDGKLGSVVLVPSDADDAKVAFKVIAGIDGQDAEECKAPNYGPKCIVARRALRFEAHTPLTVPVVMRLSCAGVACDPTQTCVQGGCVDATIDPSKCEGSGCGESALGGGGGPGDAGVDATTDGASDATVDATNDANDATIDASDAGEDAPLDAPVESGPGIDGAVLGCDLRGLQPGAPYAMDGYCPSHRGRSAFLGPAARPTQQWVRPFDEVLGAEPIVAADGTIYLATAGLTFYALDPDGGTRWTYSSGTDFDAGPRVSGTPAIGADGTVYTLIGDPTPSLVALHPDGGTKWRADVSESRSSLTIGPDGTIYYADTTAGIGTVPSNGGKGLSVKAGLGATDFSSPSVGPDGTLYVADESGYMTALYPDGGVKWRTSLDTNLGGTGGQNVPIAPDGTLRGWSYGSTKVHGVASDGGILWSLPAPSAAQGMAVDDQGGTLYGTQSEALYVTEGGDASAPLTALYACAAPMIAGDGTIFISCAGHILAVDGATLSVLWDYPYSGSINGAPVIGAGRVLYFTVYDYDATHSALYALW
jgi:hypothetical protein